MSKRSNLRASIRVVLMESAAFTAANTVTDRHYPLDMEKLPVTIITTNDTERIPYDQDDMLYQVTVVLEHYARTTTASTVEDALDARADAAEAALLAFPRTLPDDEGAGTIEDIIPLSQSFEYDDSGEQITGVCLDAYLIHVRYENTF